MASLSSLKKYLEAKRGAVVRLFSDQSSSDYLPQYSHLLHDVVRNMDGSVHGLFEVAGARFEELGADELAAQHEEMCELHRTLNLTHRLTISSHLVRTEATEEDLPPVESSVPFSAQLEQGYRVRLLDGGLLWRNTLLLGVTIRPPTFQKEGTQARTRDPKPVDQDDLDALESIMATLRTSLDRKYGLRRLGLRGQDGQPYVPGASLAKKQILYSEIAEAHTLILTGRRIRVPLPAGRLSRAICAHRPVFLRNRRVALQGVGSYSEAALFGFSVYPVDSYASSFDKLLCSNYRFVLSQSMGTMPLHEAQGLVGRTSNNFVSSGDPAYTQLAELVQAKDELQQRRYGLGPHNLTLMVLADDRKALNRASGKADDDLRNCGAIISRLDLDLKAAYFGQVPGAEGLHPRAAPIKTRNFAAFSSLHGFPTGWVGGKWCDIGATFTTNGRTPYHWNPHISESGGRGDVPHALFTGPTGSGKSTLMAWLLACLMARAGARVVLWDKDRGLNLFVLRMGGTYIQIRVGHDTGLAPLKALNGSDPMDMDFLGQGVRALILSDKGAPLKPEDHHRIDLGLRLIMDMPAPLRSLRELSAFLGVQTNGLGARLYRWCAGQPLGWVWDNEQDHISLDSQIVGFDQTQYLDHPDACGPIQSYLFHRTGKLVGQGRMIVSIDEFQKSLENDAFETMIGNGLATFRKEDCAMWLATQSVSTQKMARKISHVIREQCLTQFHFPNGGAKWADFGEDGLGLTERAFDWVLTGLSGGGRGRFLLKQGSKYTPLQLDLEGMDEELATLVAESDTVKLMDQVEKDMPDANVEALFGEWNRRRKMPGRGLRNDETPYLKRAA